MATSPSTTELIATCIFALALVHTFSVTFVARWGRRFPQHAGIFHLLGEVEVVFGFWAMVLMMCMIIANGTDTAALVYAKSRNYTEPMFVFVVMVMAASKPILYAVSATLQTMARALPLPANVSMAWFGLALVPLLGSLITEPAAMTLAALMLSPIIFRPGMPEYGKYLVLGILFVNISIGGTLSAYAAPPVLMVASTWEWGTAFMLLTFGWKAALAVCINATAGVLLLYRHLRQFGHGAPSSPPTSAIPLPVVATHVILLVGVVMYAHHSVVFMGIFLLFLGFVSAYARYQNPLILKEALLVGFFLSGLVLLGGMQRWWLQSIVSHLEPMALFWGALGLTAITDNAALTYLGSQVAGISGQSQYMLMAGAVAGGGLTVIANAPNPAGLALLKHGFVDEAVSAPKLLLAAAVPTAVATMAFLLL